MLWPVNPEVVDTIGQSVCTHCRPATKEHPEGSPHNGIDLYVPGGTVVSAPVSGKVLRVVNGSDSDDEHAQRAGLWVDIGGRDGRVHRLLHLGIATVKQGDSIKEGDIVGEVSSSGSGIKEDRRHLHYEIREWPKRGDAYGDPIDPRKDLADVLISKSKSLIPWWAQHAAVPALDFLNPTQEIGADRWDVVRNQIARAEKETDPGKRLTEARAAIEGAAETSGKPGIWSDAYYYLSHKKEGLSVTVREGAHAAVNVVKKVGKDTIDIIKPVWEDIPTYAKWTGAGVGALLLYHWWEKR